jgi:hypothetical protein
MSLHGRASECPERDPVRAILGRFALGTHTPRFIGRPPFRPGIDRKSRAGGCPRAQAKLGHPPREIRTPRLKTGHYPPFPSTRTAMDFGLRSAAAPFVGLASRIDASAPCHT